MGCRERDTAEKREGARSHQVSLAVKILLGHKGADVTDDVYLHMGANWLRAELSKFKL